MPDKTVIYHRSAATDQSDPSFANELTLLRTYCAQQGLDVSSEYLDEGVSGNQDLKFRPAGQRLLTGARDHGFTTVVVSDLSRLGRSASTLVSAYQELIGLSIRVISRSQSEQVIEQSLKLAQEILNARG
jgi:DNA invertase Pin-like site-specific DNA recombinase